MLPKTEGSPGTEAALLGFRSKDKVSLGHKEATALFSKQKRRL
jgi:hypothetical protein